MSELKYTATQMNNVLSSSQEYYRNWREAEKINKELRARISELSQAVGLTTTLKPTMVMDVDHPLDMAKEVVEHVTARVDEFEGESERFTVHSDIERQDDKWIPVSERLPDNWESVLTIDISKSTRDMVTAFYNPETSLWSTHFSCDLWVTHWMPLPESPIVYGKESEE